MKIGVFDSGIGGLNVLNELVCLLPEARFLYVGDSAHVPYGGRPIEEIRRLSRDAVGLLRERSLDLAVIACNSVSVHALDVFREELDEIPVVGMIESAVGQTAEIYGSLHKGNPILVLGTQATVRSGFYRSRLQALFPEALIYEQACPAFVPLIEGGELSGAALDEAVGRSLRGIPPGPAGLALLACTHYGWIREAIERALPGWTVVDPSRAAALAAQCLAWQIQAPRPGAAVSESRIEWIFTAPDRIPAFARAAMKSLESRLEQKDVRT